MAAAVFQTSCGALVALVTSTFPSCSRLRFFNCVDAGTCGVDVPCGKAYPAKINWRSVAQINCLEGDGRLKRSTITLPPPCMTGGRIGPAENAWSCKDL